MIHINRSDRMDRLISAAVRQGFRVWQTQTGAWYFRKGTITTMSFWRTPVTSSEWIEMVNALRGAGLVFPIKPNGDDPEDLT